MPRRAPSTALPNDLKLDMESSLAIRSALARIVLFLLALCVALGSTGCVTGQTASEFFQPDQFLLGVTLGDENVDGQFGTCGVPYASDGDFSAVTGTLGWDLSPSREAEASRATMRAVHALTDVVAQHLAVRDAQPPAVDMQAPRCSGPARAHPTLEPSAHPPLADSDAPTAAACASEDAATPRVTRVTRARSAQPDEVLVDTEDVLYLAVGLVTLAVGYLNRKRIPGVRRMRMPRLRREPKGPR